MSEVTDAVAVLLADLSEAEVSYVSTAVLLKPTPAGTRLRRVDLADDAAARMKELAGDFQADLTERVPLDYG